MTGVTFERRGPILIAGMSGEIDIATAEPIQDAILSEALSVEGMGVVVDLSDVGFLDSSGVRLLFAVHRAMVERGVPMAIVVPEGAKIASVLSIVDIASVVWMSQTVDAAIAMLLPPDAARQPAS